MNNPNLQLVICDRVYEKPLSVKQYTGFDLRSEISGLTYSFNMPGGPGTLTFNISRNPREYWSDIEPSRALKLYYEGELKWAGDIDGVSRKISEKTQYAVSCVGWCGRLKTNGPDADHTYDLAVNEKLSTYIIAHILTDTELGFSTDTTYIDTNDFEIVSGIEVYPGKPWWDIVMEAIKYSGYDFWVDTDKRIHYQPKSSSVDYEIRLSDCKESDLDRNRDKLINWVQYAYTPDGAIYGYVTAEDTDSQAIHGIRRAWESASSTCTPAEAQQLADTYIALNGKLKPSSSVTTDIIRNAQKQLITPFDCEAGKVLQIPDLITQEESVSVYNAINEYCTWQIAELTVNVDEFMGAFSPGNLATRLDTMLAQLEVRSYG
jgi:hypothetical protein